MKRKTTVLKSRKGRNIKMLKETHKRNPYHARVLFLSDSFHENTSNERLVMEEYFHEDGTPVQGRFKLSIEYTRFYINEKHELESYLEVGESMSANNGIFTYKEKENSILSKAGLRTNYNKNMDVTLPMNIQMFTDFCMKPIALKHGFSEWFARFPWMQFMLEWFVLTDHDLTDIYAKKLFTLKKALKEMYPYFNMPQARKYHELIYDWRFKAKERLSQKGLDPLTLLLRLHAEYYHSRGLETASTSSRDEETNKYEARFLRYEFITEHLDVFSNLENFNFDWLYSSFKSHGLVKNLATYARMLERKINCAWSESKLNDYNNIWTKEYVDIIYEYQNRVLVGGKVFKDFATRFGFTQLCDLKSLNAEGMRQMHCVGGYDSNIESGSNGVYTYGDYTFALSFYELSDFLRLGDTKRRRGLNVSEFRGFKNCHPSSEAREYVEQKVVKMNRELLTMPYEKYAEYLSDIKCLEKCGGDYYVGEAYDPDTLVDRVVNEYDAEPVRVRPRGLALAEVGEDVAMAVPHNDEENDTHRNLDIALRALRPLRPTPPLDRIQQLREVPVEDIHEDEEVLEEFDMAVYEDDATESAMTEFVTKASNEVDYNIMDGIIAGLKADGVSEQTLSIIGAIGNDDEISDMMLEGAIAELDMLSNSKDNPYWDLRGLVIDSE